MDYSRLTAVLIEATKEQQALIGKQQQETKTLRSELQARRATDNAQNARLLAQQAQIAQLESQVAILQASLNAKRRIGSTVHMAKGYVAARHSETN